MARRAETSTEQSNSYDSPDRRVPCNTAMVRRAETSNLKSSSDCDVSGSSFRRVHFAAAAEDDEDQTLEDLVLETDQNELGVEAPVAGGPRH